MNPSSNKIRGLSVNLSSAVTDTENSEEISFHKESGPSNKFKHSCIVRLKSTSQQ